MTPLIHLSVVAGPDAGRHYALGPGEWIVGRARGCTVSLDDPALEAHHAVVSIAAAGMTILQLAGRIPLLVDGVALCLDAGRAPIASSLEIGHSALEVGSGGSPPPHPGSVILGIDADGAAVTVDLDRHPAIAVVVDPGDPHLVAMAWTVARSLASQAGAAGWDVTITERASHVTAREPGSPTLVAVLPPSSPAIGHCTARLDLGARWRARWTPDRRRPLNVTRVHLRGGSRSADAVGPVVGEQVAGALAQRAGDVARVPQTA